MKGKSYNLSKTQQLGSLWEYTVCVFVEMKFSVRSNSQTINSVLTIYAGWTEILLKRNRVKFSIEESNISFTDINFVWFAV
jgi:hypothetical protein